MTTLICGSLAFDNIMVFPDRFKNHILPEQIHILNVAFLVPEMRREFGGCAGNIAYNLMLLGGEPMIMATVGDDAAPYLDRLDKLGLARTHVRQISGSFTAQAFITTDLDDKYSDANMVIKVDLKNWLSGSKGGLRVRATLYGKDHKIVQEPIVSHGTSCLEE